VICFKNLLMALVVGPWRQVALPGNGDLCFQSGFLELDEIFC